MGRRKVHKRSRQKAKSHEVQRSCRQHARASKRRQYDSKAGSTSNPHQNSPELMLSESQHEDLLYDNRLSPEIVSAKIKVEVETYGDDAEIGVDIGVQRTKQSQRKSCDLKRNAESADSLLSLEGCSKHDITKLITGDALDLTDASSSSSLSLNNDENETADVTERSHDERSAASALDTEVRFSGTSQLPMFRSNLESLRDDAFYADETPRPANPGEQPETNGQEFPEGTSVEQTDWRRSGTMNDCRLMDKTLSMNDDLSIGEMNNYTDERVSSIMKHSSFKTLPPIAILQSRPLSESARSARSCESDKWSESTGDVRLSLDEFQVPPGSVDERNKLWNNPKKGGKILNGSNKRFDVVLETVGKHLTVNWRELRKIFARLNRRIHQDEERDCAPLLPKYGWLPDDQRIPYVSISMPSPKNATGSSASCNSDEDEEAGKQRRSTTRVEVPSPLSEERRKRKQLSFPPTQPSCDKTRRDGRSSTSTSDLDQLALTDYDSLQEIKCQDGTCKRQTTATSQASQSYAESRRRSIPRVIITWVIALCIWLKKKLLHLSDSCKKLRQRFSSSPSSEIKTDRLVATLRTDNEKMMCELSERMTRLSVDFSKVRTDAETTLNVLASEVNAVREASKKMNENNAMLMLELKKLRGTLQEIESKSSQPAFSTSSYPPLSSHSLPPPRAPLIFPPSQPPPIASDNTLKSAIPPPPPPPPPPVFPQSAGPSTIQLPTTPNSSRGSKCRTPTRKCFTPLLNRPSITVEDLLKVTLKKAPQSIKDNRRNTIPGPRGPVVSLEMLRNVKLKSTKRSRLSEQAGRSPRSGRIVKNRATPNISLSPILTGSEGNLERILRRVDSNRPRRLLSASSSLHDRDFVKETQSLETLTHNR